MSCTKGQPTCDEINSNAALGIDGAVCEDENGVMKCMLSNSCTTDADCNKVDLLPTCDNPTGATDAGECVQES